MLRVQQCVREFAKDGKRRRDIMRKRVDVVGDNAARANGPSVVLIGDNEEEDEAVLRESFGRTTDGVKEKRTTDVNGRRSDSLKESGASEGLRRRRVGREARKSGGGKSTRQPLRATRATKLGRSVDSKSNKASNGPSTQGNGAGGVPSRLRAGSTAAGTPVSAATKLTSLAANMLTPNGGDAARRKTQRRQWGTPSALQASALGSSLSASPQPNFANT